MLLLCISIFQKLCHTFFMLFTDYYKIIFVIIATRAFIKIVIKFFIANNYNLAKKCNADGLYISSYNRKFYKNIKKIGSAHNYNEIIKKIRQGCEMIVLSRLFRTDYKEKTGFFNIVKFNLIVQKFKIDFIPLGGIKNSNLIKLNMVNSKGLAIYSEIKKKPVIYNRLF